MTKILKVLTIALFPVPIIYFMLWLLRVHDADRIFELILFGCSPMIYVYLAFRLEQITNWLRSSLDDQ